MKQNRTPVKSKKIGRGYTPTKTERSAPVSVFPRQKLHLGRTFMSDPG